MSQDRLDRLYELSPENFISERDELAKQLKAEGDAERAKQVKALRRPSVAAWAINQAARSNPKDVEQLLAVGRELGEAQRRALSSKGGGDLKALGSRRRAAVDKLTKLAAAALDDAGKSSASHLDQIRNTLTAASADPEVGELVRAGRLDRERDAATDFGDVFGSALETTPAKEKAADDTAEIDAAERAAQHARREADQAAAKAERARQAADEARAQADRKDDAAAEAEQHAAQARKDAQKAERALERLKSKG